MNPADGTPLAILSFSVAPAVLTNASSALTLTTSNRFARAIDRARSLHAQIEGREKDPDEGVQLRIRLLRSVEQRARFLVRALNAYYLAVAAFGVASLASLVGAVLQIARASGAGTAAFLIAFRGRGGRGRKPDLRLEPAVPGIAYDPVDHRHGVELRARALRKFAAPLTAVSSASPGSSAYRRV
jgi:hypothetical protein